MFSKFSYCIRPPHNSFHLQSLTESQSRICWLQLEEDDHNPGRFWLKFIAALRLHFPDVGKDILNSLVDHHSQPIGDAIKKLSHELQAQPIKIIFENMDYIDQQKWWQQDVQTWLYENENIHCVVMANQPATYQLTDAFSEEIEEISKNSKQKLSGWLQDQGEMLELLRLYLQEKDFELAGDLLEQYGENWLHEEIDSLELLFWLRELPSVLLTARPALCWLAALACKELGLTYLVNFYINAAENSLASFMRFSRVESEWRKIELNEAGLSIGRLMDQLEQLKIKN